jgi:MoxR-like ATPase
VTPLDAILDLQKSISRTVLGQEAMIERLLIGLLANGNLLVEGLPGLAKTRAIKKLGKFLDAGLSRIQFTPDLLPSDITGSEIYYTAEGKGEFLFQPGPVFNNLVLADEINRAPAKVQAALLEAMEERQVTVAGKTHALPKLFLVMATQNPIEQEGTFALPEAQLDRFIMHVTIGYPDAASELAILRLAREQASKPVQRTSSVTPIVTQEEVFAAREAALSVHMAPALEQYIAQLVLATREAGRYGSELKRWIAWGASPRATIALDRCARAHAWLNGRDFVLPENVHAIVYEVLRHRVLLSYEAEAEGIRSEKVINRLLDLVPLP